MRALQHSIAESPRGETVTEAKLTPLLIGALTFVPGLRQVTARRTGGTTSARYCYSVWLRHLTVMAGAGLPTRFGTMVEVGPGDSLGIGLAALLSGGDRYVALDIVRYAEPERNLRILREVTDLFRARAPIPDEREFPRVQPRLADYRFPHGLLSADRLDAMLDPRRLRHLESLIVDPPAETRSGAAVSYVTPWHGDVIEAGSVDLIVSQSVLQYTRDLPATYRDMARWLRPGGVMSHEIDFKSIGRTRSWNGHWACSEGVWAIMQGRRRNPLNRAPLSRHIRIQKALGFDIVTELPDVRTDGIARAELAPAFAALDDADLTTASVLLQSRKRGASRCEASGPASARAA